MDFIKENFYTVILVLLFLLGLGVAIFLELMFILFEKLTSKKEDPEHGKEKIL